MNHGLPMISTSFVHDDDSDHPKSPTTPHARRRLSRREVLTGAGDLLSGRDDMAQRLQGLTQAAVDPGRTFAYRFTAPDAGTYWFHPHMGLELDQGLCAPLINEDPNDAVDVDVDVALMLDDWLDGYGRTQEQVLAGLEAGGGHSSHIMKGTGAMGAMMSGSGSGLNGDVGYPLHVINGRGPNERHTVTAKAGRRVRVRLINAGSDTA